jgi:GNAT superfamily N-acetyltransferase
MENMRIQFEPFISDNERKFIVDGIDYYNVAATGMPDWFPINFVLRGERGDVLGGLLGLVWGGWLQVFHLWISETARGRGHGSRLMREAEAYAKCRGAVGATLETYSFQATPFYERLGYQQCGSVVGYPVGHAKYFLKKALV